MKALILNVRTKIAVSNPNFLVRRFSGSAIIDTRSKTPVLMKSLPSLAALLILPALLLGGCDSNSAPQVRDARVVLPPPGVGMAAGYFEVFNPSSKPLRLIGVSSADFQSVEMHETVTEQGVSRMREIKEVEIPAGGSVRFEPGGRHLMLMGGPDAAPKVFRMRVALVDASGKAEPIEVAFGVEKAGEQQAH